MDFGGAEKKHKKAFIIVISQSSFDDNTYLVYTFSHAHRT